MTAPARRRFHAGALAGGLLVGCLGGWAAVEALGYGLWKGSAPGEGLFPFLIATGVAFLAAAFELEAFTDPSPSSPSAGEEGDGRPAYGKVAIYLGGLVAFGTLLEPLGYLVVTALVLILILRLAEGMTWLRSAGVVAATLLLTHIVFERLLALPLPRGELF